MTMKLAAPTLLFLAANFSMLQTPDEPKIQVTPQACQLILSNPPEFKPFQFVPKEVDFTGLNRFPKVTWTVKEDGNVSNVKIIKGIGSPKVDAGLNKSIRAWKYKPQPDCTFEISMRVIIDIGSLSNSD